MTNGDELAFNALNQGGDTDMFVTGGAITVSEYEQNMTPTDQQSYEDTLLQNFQQAYMQDPHKGSLNFKHWLKTLNPELVRERAKKWEDIRAKNKSIGPHTGMSQEEAKNYSILEGAGLIQRLAHLHTGRVEDLIPIVEIIIPEEPVTPASMGPVQQSQFREPAGYMRAPLPSAVGE